MTQPKKPTLTEIASRIDAHLKRFERDREINQYPEGHPARGLCPYYHAGALRCGNRVCVVYVSYQGDWKLDRPRAERYLAWLDEGNVGRHFRLEQLPRRKR